LRAPGDHDDTVTSPHEFLSSLRFDNSFVRELPGDPERENRPRPVRRACYTRVDPTKVRAPRLVAYAREVLALLDLPPAVTENEAFAQVFAGNRLLPGMEPYAACYGGHQFGNWAGQLGDGRAISLGELINAQGQRWELQLKGAGPTPYSRHADGRAVLRSSLREFLCSEAMHHLGIPTTRALSLVTTGERVVRDVLYDGNPRPELGAVVCRVAPSFLRFGNFELPASRDEHDVLEKLAAYTLRHHYPELGEPGPDAYVAMLSELSRRTAELVVHWLRVGFVHGVMNTDNMSVLGLTIDYGPYGFLDNYDPDWTPNTTDAEGRRYRYSNQPRIALWNLVQLANALYPLVGSAPPLEAALDLYRTTLEAAQQRMFEGKLGIETLSLAGEGSPDKLLLTDLLELLSATEIDMTIFYRKLADVRSDLAPAACDDATLVAPLLSAYYAAPAEPERMKLASWLRRYVARVRQDGAPDSVRRLRMNQVNPKYILRNYLAQQAIDQAEAGDMAPIAELLDLVRRPYDEQPEREHFADKRPDWARHRVGCSMLSCSS
jgi:serine/tyrosine/threonine adenylyltransferase